VRLGADGSLEVEKHLSDRVDLAALGAGAPDVRRGTTIATNALLERTGVPVLLVVTRGFGDLPWIGDGTRPDLFALRIERPPALATEVLEIDGRIDAEGREVEPHVIPKFRRPRGLESAAVVLVHGPLAPAIEDRVAQSLRDAGFAHVSVGHEVAPSRGFLERLNTTLADAALTPLLPKAPGLYLRSDGGLAREHEFRGRDAILSGPAGGVIATAQLAKEAGLEGTFGLDMGEPLAVMCEYVAVLQQALHGQAAFEGRYYRVRWTSAFRAPAPPVLLAGLAPPMLELAGEISDGVVLWLATPAYVRDVAVPALARGRARAGKPLEGFEIVAAVPLAVTQDHAGATGLFREELVRYLSLPFYRTMFRASGFGDALAAFDRDRKQWGPGRDADAVPAELADALGAIGDARRARAEVERYREAGVTLPVVRPIGSPEAAHARATLEATAP